MDEAAGERADRAFIVSEHTYDTSFVKLIPASTVTNVLGGSPFIIDADGVFSTPTPSLC